MKKSEKLWFPPSTSSDKITKEFHIKFDSKEEEVDVPNENLPYRLAPLESIASACVLQEAVYQLSIVSDIYRAPNSNRGSYNNFEQRFKKTSAENFDLETMEPNETALLNQIHFKLQKDISFIKKVLDDSIDSLLTSNTFNCLVNQLDENEKKINEENRLLETVTQNKVKVEKFKLLIKNEEKQFLGDIETQSKLLGTLKDEYEDLIVENNCKLEYIKNWENSKIEQNYAKLQREEQQFLKVINDNKMNIDREKRIHAEIEAFTAQCTKDLEDKIQYWINNYNHEIATRDVQIQELDVKRQLQLEKLEKLSNLYEERNMEMANYLELKENRKREAELLNKKHKNATKIQAWWKGTMVRRGLGPFSRKRKGKDKDGKKKGKK